MKHLRQHYETVYRTICKESATTNLLDQAYPIIVGNYTLMCWLNSKIEFLKCIPYTQEELYTISESMEY